MRVILKRNSSILYVRAPVLNRSPDDTWEDTHGLSTLRIELFEYLEEKGIDFFIGGGEYRETPYGYRLVLAELQFSYLRTLMWHNVIRPQIEHMTQGLELLCSTQYLGSQLINVQITIMS